MRASSRLGPGALGAATGILLLVGCGGSDDIEVEHRSLTKATPVQMRSEGASGESIWALFDRSTSAGWQPDGDGESATIIIELGAPRALAALKVFGPAPYRVSLLRGDGSPVEHADFDLTSLEPGWNRLLLPEVTLLSAVRLQFTLVGPPAPIAEVELWALHEETDAPGAQSAAPPITSDRYAMWVASSSVPSEAKLGPTDGSGTTSCAAFSIVLSQHPATLRRARLVYRAENVFRSFALRRGLNGAALEGGAWITDYRGSTTFEDPIDPELLVLGENEVQFCLPEEAHSSATIRDLHIVGEMEPGRFGEVAIVRAGEEVRDAAAVLDGDRATSLSLGPAEALVISLERFVAPDALALSPESAAASEWRVACQDETGTWQELEASSHHGVLLVERGDLACSALSLSAASAGAPVDLAEVTVVGSGARERVDWPTLQIASAPEHFGHTAWVGGWATPPSLVQGPVRVAVDGHEVESVSGTFGRLLTRDTDESQPWSVDVTARFSTGAVVSRTVLLDTDSADALDQATEPGEDEAAIPGGTASAPTVIPWPARSRQISRPRSG